MKDKPKRKYSMMDKVHEDSLVIPEIKENIPGFIPSQRTVMNSKADIKKEQALKEYNKNVTTLNPKYSEELRPISKVLVRCFVVEPTRTKSGIIVPHTHRVNIPTQNGLGHVDSVESPYPYSTRAVVVAIPENYDGFKQGDVVQLGDEPVRAIPMGAGKGAAVSIKHSFTHYEYKHDEPPTSVEDEHYGYLLIPTHMIDMKIVKNK